MRKGKQGVFELRAKPDTSEMDSLNVNETGVLVPLPWKVYHPVLNIIKRLSCPPGLDIKCEVVANRVEYIGHCNIGKQLAFNCLSDTAHVCLEAKTQASSGWLQVSAEASLQSIGLATLKWPPAVLR